MNKHVGLEIDNDCLVTGIKPYEESIKEKLPSAGKAAFLLGKITGALLVINDLMHREQYELAKENINELYKMAYEEVNKIYYKENK